MQPLKILTVVLLLLAGCERGAAPRDWAVRHGVDTGGAPPVDRPVTDPKNVTPHVQPEPGRDRIWVAVTTGLFGLAGIAIATGVWMLEARRRMRRVRDGLCTAIVEQLRREQFHDVTVDRGPVPLFRGSVALGLKGAVTSESDRQRVLAIAADALRRTRLPADLVDDVSVTSARRRAG